MGPALFLFRSPGGANRWFFEWSDAIDGLAIAAGQDDTAPRADDPLALSPGRRTSPSLTRKKDRCNVRNEPVLRNGFGPASRALKRSEQKEGEVKIFVNKGKLADAEGEAVILALFEGKELAGEALQIDTKSNGLIGELIDSHDFEAKPSQISVIYTRGSLPAKRIVLVGFGKQSEFNLEKLRGSLREGHAAFADLKHQSRRQLPSIRASLPNAKDKVAQAVAEGALLGLYQYAPFKTVDRENLKDMEQLTIVAGENDFPLIEAAVEKAQAIARAVYFTRDLVSAPSNRMTPAILAKEAAGIAARRGVSCTVLDKAKLNELGMNSLLSVASGSNEEPRFIILEYKGGETDAAPIVLVGKGVTFDSGGICIKPSDKMDEMKSDMAGGGRGDGRDHGFRRSAVAAQHRRVDSRH